jgi:prolyl 4-hydroxylase
MSSKKKEAVLDSLAPMRLEMERRMKAQQPNELSEREKLKGLKQKLFFKVRMMTTAEIEEKLTIFCCADNIHKETLTAKKERLVTKWYEMEEKKVFLLETISRKTGLDTKNIQILNVEPDIYYIDEFIEPKQCEHLISIASKKVKDNPHIDWTSRVQGKSNSKMRTGTTCFMEHNNDAITEAILTKICSVIEKQPDTCEPFSISKYEKGEAYNPHYDGVSHDRRETTLNFMRFGGQRQLTALMYLNEGDGLGETEFVHLGIKVKPVKGRVLIFENTKKNTNILDEKTCHAGLPTESGEKWICNLWFREFNYNEYYKDHNPGYYSGWWLRRGVGKVFGKEVNNEFLLAMKDQKKGYIMFTPETPRKRP